MTSSKHYPAIGIPLTILASLSNAAMATSAKLVGVDASSSTIVFMRYLVSLILLICTIPFIKKKNKLKELTKINKPLPHCVRIVSALGCLYAYFFALNRIPLSTAVVLIFTSPLFIPIITWIWKRIRIPPPIWWALFTGFAGVLLVVGPQFTSFHSGLLAGLCAGVLSAISFVASRILTKSEPAFNINFYLFLASTVISFAIGGVSFIHKFPLFTGTNWLLLVAVGFFGFFYQFLMVRAVKYTRIRYVGAFLYFTILFSFLAEWLLFNKVPSYLNYIGMLLIILAGVLMTFLDPAKKKG